MKPSSFKQLLKSCKDGITLVIQRQSGINFMLPGSVPNNHQNGLTRGKLIRDLSIMEHGSLSLTNGSLKPLQSPRYSSEFVSSPGTPRSNISETSAGYYSLTHSVPSELSNTQGGPDLKTGQMHLESPQQGVLEHRKMMTKHLSEGSCVPEFISPRYRAVSIGGGLPSSGFSKGGYRGRPSDFHSPRRSTTCSAAMPPRMTSGKHHHAVGL